MPEKSLHTSTRLSASARLHPRGICLQRRGEEWPRWSRLEEVSFFVGCCSEDQLDTHMHTVHTIHVLHRCMGPLSIATHLPCKAPPVVHGWSPQTKQIEHLQGGTFSCEGPGEGGRLRRGMSRGRRTG